MNISAEQHVHVLAAAQRNVDNSVSKTCNGAVNDTVESVDRLYQTGTPAGLQGRQLLPRRLARQSGAHLDEGSTGSTKGEMACNPEAQRRSAVTSRRRVMLMPRTLFRSIRKRRLARAKRDSGRHGCVQRGGSRAQPFGEQADADAKLTAIRIERPRELSGATWQIPFDGQNLYVTVNHDGR